MPDNQFFLDTLTKLDNVLFTEARGFSKAPDKYSISCWIDGIRSLMFPQFEGCMLNGDQNERINTLYERLKTQVELAYRFADEEGDAEEICKKFFSLLPSVKETLLKDIKAIYEGDPAAKSQREVLLCYPGFTAIFIYRIAHEFYLMKVPYIHRLMTEYAHQITGVDIHAGAKIGEYFCIDHGTGIVIGETTVIGDHVKLYQGVTLGAKSFETDSDGNPIKGIKRHPEIGNNVVIYANATILGGDTKIGDNCVIGGNVWLTRSVPEGQTVSYDAKQVTRR